MDMKLFKQHLAKNQKLNESEVRYGTKYPGFTVTIPPDEAGTIVTKNGIKVRLAKGDVVTIRTVNGHTYSNVTLTSVIDISHDNLGGKIRFKVGGGEIGFSGNGLQSIEK